MTVEPPAAPVPRGPTGAGEPGDPPTGWPPQAPTAWPPQAPTAWAGTPPQRLADVPRADPPRPRHGGVLALTGLAAAVIAGLVLVVALPDLPGLITPGRAGPGASASPTAARTAATPGAGPTATMPTDPVELLKHNPVYAIAVPAKCPAQRAPANRTAFRRQVKALVACENGAWKKALAKTPVDFSAPKVRFYDRSATSPCGRLGDEFPAAYCSSDRTLYFETASYTQGGYYRLAVAQVVMHEYAHHVQELAGIFGAGRALREKDAVTGRRIELQAHCMAHYQLTHSRIDFTARDAADAEFQFGYTADPEGHGSVRAERHWGRLGLAASTIGACNTWKVKASKVK